MVYSLYRQRYKEQKEFPQGSSEQKIADVFSAAGNTMYRDKLGLAPVREFMERIDGVKDMKGLLECMAYLEYNGFHGLLPVAVSVDAYDSSKYVLAYSDVYTGMNVSMVQGKEPEKVIAAYENYLTELFSLFGSEADAAAKQAEQTAALCAEPWPGCPCPWRSTMRWRPFSGLFHAGTEKGLFQSGRGEVFEAPGAVPGGGDGGV